MSARRHGAEIVVVQTVIPDYRIRFLASLSETLGSRLVLISGVEDFTADLAHAGGVPHLRVRNRFLARRFLWQSGILSQVVGAHVAVLVLNPRIGSNWVALILRRVLRRRTILWGHSWPQAGATSWTDPLRDLMRRLASSLIVYTESEARDLRARAPGIAVVAAPNALYTRSELEPTDGTVEPTDLVFVGRLNSAKKPGLLLEAFRRAAPELPREARLVFVGEGPVRTVLESEARSLGLAERVLFLGHVSQIDVLRATYARAIASASPGPAGLSLIQSLGFGVPMIVARGEPHGPEIEAAVDGDNVVYVPRDSPEELADALVRITRDRAVWLARREEIAAPIRRRYSIEGMVLSFVAALQLDGTPPGLDHETTFDDDVEASELAAAPKASSQKEQT